VRVEAGLSQARCAAGNANGHEGAAVAGAGAEGVGGKRAGGDQPHATDRGRRGNGIDRKGQRETSKDGEGAAHLEAIRQGCYQSAMRAVVQRVSRAEVRVGVEVTGRIGHGLVVLLGAGDDDVDADLGYLVDKVVGLRIFADDEGNMNRSVVDVGGALLVVSQFTLYGDARKGRRPSFVKAMAPGPAEQMYEKFVAAARATGVPVETGRFRAMMQVELVNDGPVTLLLDSKRQF
jgi:D-tyrosyl-tRNA(Tyr) deacylase